MHLATMMPCPAAMRLVNVTMLADVVLRHVGTGAGGRRRGAPAKQQDNERGHPRQADEHASPARRER
jgi:hypothetical protein